jgi:ABC-type phosphate transport system auxiliary subunit
MKFLLFGLFLFFLTGCNQLLMTPETLKQIQNQAEIVEEEFDDASQTSQERYKVLNKQIEKITSINNERKLFDGAMDRMTQSLVQDIKEFTTQISSLNTNFGNLNKKTQNLLNLKINTEKTWEKDWIRRTTNIKKIFCLTWEKHCEKIK